MSLLSINRKTIHLSPAGVAGLARSRFSPDRVASAYTCAVPGSEDGKLDLSCLEETVRKLGGGDIELVLGDHFIHYKLFPYQEGLQSLEEEVAFVRHAYTHLWGRDAELWRIALSDETPGAPKVAAAIDGNMIDGLADSIALAGGKLVSVRPGLICALNFWREEMDDSTPQWFLLHDDGLLAIALLEKGVWRWVRTRRVGAQWADGWRDIIADEMLMLGEDVPGATVWLCAPGVNLPKDQTIDGVTCQSLSLDAQLGLAGIEDRRLQFAWMA